MSEAEWFEAHQDKGHDVGNRRENGQLVTSTCHDCEARWFADQPVTPDREALVRIADEAITAWLDHDPTPAEVIDRGNGHDTEGRAAVDALLPLLTDALDRARQQGREEMAGKVTDWLAIGGTDLLARRLARGGPNRKDDDG